MSDESKGKTLYIFIDESGNFDFTHSGTKHFVLTAVSTVAPLVARDSLLHKIYELKYAGWNEGRGTYYFHATEDRQETRDWMFDAIKNLKDIEIDAIVVQKNKANPSLYFQSKANPKLVKDGITKSISKSVRSEEKFYDKMAQMLLQYIFARHKNDETIERVVVVLGSLFTDKKRGYVLKSLKQYLKTSFKKPFYIYFHATAADINCQIADYCGWAVYVNYERGETRPFQEINDKIQSCFSVFRNGTTTYYEYDQ